MREVWRDVAWTSAAKIYAMLVGMAVVAISARALGPAGRGQLVVITSWVSAFATVLHMSLGQVAIHRAAHSKDGEWLADAWAALLRWCGLATLIGWLSAGALYSSSTAKVFSGIDPWLLSVGFLLLPPMIWEQYSSSLLMAIGRLDIANRAQVQGRSLTLLSILGCWLAHATTVVSVLASNIAGQLVTAAVGIRRLRQTVRGPARSGCLPSYLQAGSRLHLNAIGAFLFSTSDILVLNHFAGPESASYYQLGVQLIMVMMVVPQAATSVMFSKVAQLGPDRAWASQRQMLLRMLAIMATLGLASALAAHWIIVVIAGEAFLPAVDIFRVQLLAVPGMTLSALMAPQWIGRGFFKLASAITLGTGVLSLSLSLLLVPKLGIWGAVTSNLVTFGISVVGNCTFAYWCQRRAGSEAAA